MGTYRDAYGVPHLWADSTDQLAFLQGSNAATDRAWQIELDRWRAEGRVAEHLGPSGLPWDRLARRVQIMATARRAFDHVDERTQRWCAAFVDGVNAALPVAAGSAPEFALVGAAPEAWQPWTPLGLHLARHLLFATYPDKFWRDHVRRTLGEDALRLFVVEGPMPSGSNAWAVAGERTASGDPLVAGDPHRILDLPGSYQQVRLACPSFDVVGLAFPGVPGLPHFAHTGDVAWAVTNAQADYQDVYREDLRRDGTAVQAKGPEGWRPVDLHHETIAVAGRDPEPLEVITTARGPVIIGEPGTDAYSLRCPSIVDGDLGFASLLPLLEAHTVDDVIAAWSHWVEPVNCVLTADRSGRVAGFLAGRVPVRDDANRAGSVPAWEEWSAWSGTYAQPPVVQVEDVIANANDRASGAELGVSYAAPHRANRIHQLLVGRTGLDVEDMTAIHNDTTQLAAATAQHLLARVEVGGAAERLRQRLLAWDGRMDADSTDAAAFTTWRSALVRLLVAHPVLAPADEPTGLPELYDGWTSLVQRTGLAWETALQLADELEIDIVDLAGTALIETTEQGTTGTWGEAHRLAPFSAIADHGWSPMPDLPTVNISGDSNCVLATGSLPGVTDVCTRGSLARYVWDLADRDNSRWIVPFGANGVPGTAHFADQLPLWAGGELIPIVTDWDQLTPG